MNHAKSGCCKSAVRHFPMGGEEAVPAERSGPIGAGTQCKENVFGSAKWKGSPQLDREVFGGEGKMEER